MKWFESLIQGDCVEKDGVWVHPSPKNSFFSSRTREVYSEFWKRVGTKLEETEYSAEGQFLQRYRLAFQDKIVVDAGCGNGRLMRHWLDFGAQHIIFIDDSDAIFDCRRIAEEKGVADRCLFIKASLLQIPLKNQSVDTVFCSGTLGLIEDQDKAMAELFRVSHERVIVGVLTEKTLTGKIYLYLNWIKPIINRVQNFNLIFAIAKGMAGLIWLFFKLCFHLGIRTPLLTTEVLRKIIEDRGAVRRLQLALYDPLLIPKVKKHPDAFYFRQASSHAFQLKEHVTAIICDYFDFVARQFDGKSPLAD